MAKWGVLASRAILEHGEILAHQVQLAVTGRQEKLASPASPE
jgi:hypothetical protein